MTTALEAHLRDCTVLLCDAQGTPAGSGFFVAEGLILTAAHVLAKAGDAVRAYWRGASIGSLERLWIAEERQGADGEYPLPDLALLSVLGDQAAGHPCVMLGAEDPGPYLVAEGYTRGVAGGQVADSARLEFESVRPEPECIVFKLKDSIIDKGLSGGPLLDLNSGHVVAVTKAQRTGRLPLGGIAVGAATIRDRQPEVWAANARFHQTDRRWDFARISGGSMVDPLAATEGYLHNVRAVLARRPVITPAGADVSVIHQIPSVRAARSTDAASSMADELSHGNRGWSANDLSVDGVFRWAPLRVRWSAVVLSGMPGVGKSYLLTMHADVMARDALERLDDGAAPFSAEIPILVDCAALGRVLPERISRDGVISALIGAFWAAADGELEEESSRSAFEAVVRLAYADGRLVTCLDALDEAGVRERQRVLQALTYLADRGNSLVVTSRPQPRLRADTSKLPGCFRAEVVGFSTGQVFAFARAWFADDHGLAERFEAGLRERQELRALARVPLLAAFLCRLVSEGDDVRALPTSAAELYAAVVAAALSGHWRDPSRQAIDPDSPPDPSLRLRLLTRAVGVITGPWRSRLDRFSVSDLDTQLVANPDYSRAALAAEARLEAWRALQPQDRAAPPQASVVRWEYMFDGLFAYDASESGGAFVRFAHPVLGEYVLAAYVASLPDEDLRAAVTEHRWFDASWEHVWPLAAALMQTPDQLIEHFLDGSADSWREQTFLASRCVVGAGSKVSPALAREVVRAVAAGVPARRPFDRDRALSHLAELVHAQVPGAASAARTLMNDTALPQRSRLRIAAILAELGDAEGLAAARTSLADRAVPPAYRAWLARSVVLAEDPAGLDELTRAIKGAAYLSELLRLVAALPVETTPGGDLVANVLQDHTAPVQVRAAAGRALIRLGDPQRMKFAKAIAADPVTVWALRAALIAELLAVGEDDLIGEAVVVLRDPGISGNTAVTLLENLIRSGETTVVADAVELIGRWSVDWRDRSRLARAIAELGPLGLSLLHGMVNSALAVDLKLRPITALVEVGEALDVANRIIGDSGAPAWIRTRLACSLLEAGDKTLDLRVIAELAMDPEPGHDFQPDLIAAMAAREIPDAQSAAIQMLKRGYEKEGRSYAGNPVLIRDLAAAGHGGMTLLAKIATDPVIAEQDRALAIIGLADAEPAAAGELAVNQMEQFSTFVRSRLVILLAEKGVVEIADQVTNLLSADSEAYTALFKLLEGTRTPRSLVDQLLDFGRPAEEAPQDTGSQIQLDESYLTENGLTWSSDAQKKAMLSWIYTQLERRVGINLAAFLTTGQLDEFDELTSDEERLEFLSSRASGYPELVREQARIIAKEIRANPTLIPDFRSSTNVSTMERLSYTASVISQWLRVTTNEGQVACAEFLEANQAVILSPEGVALLQAAQRIQSGYNPYEGLYYLQQRARQKGLPAARRFSIDSDHRHDIFHELLADGRGQELLLAGLAAVLLAGRSASSYFYAALGATMSDLKGLGLVLMEQSHANADSDQHIQGRNTIQREGTRLGWDPAVIEALLAELPAPEDGESAAADE